MIKALPDGDYSASDIIDGDGASEEDSDPRYSPHPRKRNRGRFHRLEPGPKCADQLQPRRFDLGRKDRDESDGCAAGTFK